MMSCSVYWPSTNLLLPELQVETPQKSEPPQPLVNVNALLIDTEGRKQSDQGLGTELLLPAPPSASSPSTTTKVDPKIDLLSGDDFSSPTTENVLALVPVGGEPQSASPFTEECLDLVDMFSPPSNSQSPYSADQTLASSPQFRQQSFTSTLSCTQMEVSPELHIHKAPTWPGTNRYHSNSSSGQSSSFPPPPWEAEAAENSQTVGNPHAQPMQSNKLLPDHGMYAQPITDGQPAMMNQAMQNNQMVGLLPQPIQGGQSMGMFPQQMPPGHMAYMYAQQQMYGNQMSMAMPNHRTHNFLIRECLDSP
ncbi:hypothetical protein EJD97_007034 [Solanum chilense]|uniref:Uncharacterized protein n=1 Tax=Solanum chilense TaxID=4083 RepID=A0A6N2BV11_SOLCI|nr:hypothetical protein EJD97_007034 [Solanum chilense]